MAASIRLIPTDSIIDWKLLTSRFTYGQIWLLTTCYACIGYLADCPRFHVHDAYPWCCWSMSRFVYFDGLICYHYHGCHRSDRTPLLMMIGWVWWAHRFAYIKQLIVYVSWAIFVHFGYPADPLSFHTCNMLSRFRWVRIDLLTLRIWLVIIIIAAIDRVEPHCWWW